MAGISTNRTDITLPTEVSSEILQKTQEASAVMQLARQIQLPGSGLTIPVITGDPEASWVGETDIKPVSHPTLDTKIMQAYKLAVIVPFSEEFRRDYSQLYNALVARIPGALAEKFDRTVFFGTAPGSNFDTFEDVEVETMGGLDDIYQALVSADTDISVAGGLLNGFALSPQAKGLMLSATDEVGRPLFINSVTEGAIPRLLGSPVFYSKRAYDQTAGIAGFAGDWTQAVYGTVEGVKVSISDQATLTNGNSTINLWERNMFAVRAEIEVGFRADLDMFVAFGISAGNGNEPSN